MTLSTPTDGSDWASDAVAPTLDVLRALGVNWISYHPYAGIHASGHVSSWSDTDAPPAWLMHPIDVAHNRHLKVMVKPHLAPWGSGFSWRGDITFDDPVRVARFFGDYEAWIVSVAKACDHADALVVGTELDGLLTYEAEWRHIIASVRTVFSGQLTYAANWDHYQDVPFWDALDAIGIQAYFPLVDAGQPVNAQTLGAGWDRVLADVNTLSAATGKPVVFTELGYDTSEDTATRPWASGRGHPERQTLALTAALAAIARDDAVSGAFLWKWFPGDLAHGDFRMSDPRNRDVIRAAWGPQAPPAP